MSGSPDALLPSCAAMVKPFRYVARHHSLLMWATVPDGSSTRLARAALAAALLLWSLAANSIGMLLLGGSPWRYPAALGLDVGGALLVRAYFSLAHSRGVARALSRAPGAHRLLCGLLPAALALALSFATLVYMLLQASAARVIAFFLSLSFSRVRSGVRCRVPSGRAV